MERRRVLVVEDEPVINDAVADRLRAEGFHVDQAYDGPGAVAKAAEVDPELVVLDVMLPGFDGHEVCRRIQATKPVPVLMLTARDDEADVLVGLAVGADDYLTKPFNLQVLVARIEAVLRRSAPPPAAPSEKLAYGGLELDERAHRVWRDGSLVGLSPTEFKLLRYLLLNAEQVISKTQMAEHIWQYDFGGDPNLVETHISYLRRKLGEPRIIQTVRSVGYVLRSDP
jgi:DNA-binding response OmpR family regulator